LEHLYTHLETNKLTSSCEIWLTTMAACVSGFESFILSLEQHSLTMASSSKR
jgi:hypothetical protein